jgi:hypothetical protein
MGIVFNFGDHGDKMQPSEKITFGKLNFITDRLGNLRLQEPESPEEEEARPPLVHAFVARLEEAMDGGPLTFTHHLTRHAHILDVTF